jgi:hypothetical protein
MKNPISTLALSAALALSALTTGCHPALVPMTQELRDQNRLSEAELRNLQYYLSSTITLRRELESGGRQVTGNHKLVVIAGKTIEEVVVEERTPGICVGVGDHSLLVSFEQGTSIEFAPPGAGAAAQPAPGFATAPDADPFPGNHPSSPDRVAGLFSGSYTLRVEPSGTVRFLGKAFDPVDDSVKATLLIDAESLEQIRKQQKVLPGLRLQSK